MFAPPPGGLPSPPLGGLPPPPPGRDRFGLPLSSPTLLSSQDEHAAIERGVRAVVQDAWRTAVRLLGRDRAAALFREVSAGKAGAPKGSRNPLYDRELLAAYDAELASLPKGEKPNLSKLGKRLMRRKYESPRAAAVHLKRLLAQREAVEAYRRRWATKTLLEEIPPAQE